MLTVAVPVRRRWKMCKRPARRRRARASPIGGRRLSDAPPDGRCVSRPSVQNGLQRRRSGHDEGMAVSSSTIARRPRLAIAAIAAVAVALFAGAAATARASTTEASWTTYHRDTERTGDDPETTQPDDAGARVAVAEPRRADLGTAAGRSARASTSRRSATGSMRSKPPRARSSGTQSAGTPVPVERTAVRRHHADGRHRRHARDRHLRRACSTRSPTPGTRAPEAQHVLEGLWLTMANRC